MSLIDYSKVPIPGGMDFQNYADFKNWANTPEGKLLLTSRQRSSITFGKLWEKRYLPAEKDAFRCKVEVCVHIGKRVGVSRTSAVHFITLIYYTLWGKQRKEVPFMKVKNYLNFMKFQHNEAVIEDYGNNWDNESIPEDDNSPIDEDPRMQNGNRN